MELKLKLIWSEVNRSRFLLLCFQLRFLFEISKNFPVDGNWTVWSDWSSCDASCGNGSKTRSRTCSDPSPLFGGECSGSSDETDDCNEKNCPIDGGWSDWSGWSFCDATCGNSTHTNTRTCTQPAPSPEGLPCIGQNQLEEICTTVTPCPVDGQWNTWSPWTSCSVTCGNGLENRTRQCNNPAPQYEGSTCNETDLEGRWCVNYPCAINGNWSAWYHWEPCDVTCGNGTQVRVRECSDPATAFGGDDCTGFDIDEQDCINDPCTIHGNWASWSEWGSCSATCGLSHKLKSRSCTDPIPQNDGDYCFGSNSTEQACYTSACPIDGNWTLWTEWGICDVTCGAGTQLRERTCTNPYPLNNGTPCDGEESDSQVCDTIQCPEFSQWSDWESCTATCGDGK